MHEYSLLEVGTTLIGLGLTGAFAAWAAVIKRAAEEMASQVNRVINELSKLREEMHRDRVYYERRFARIETHMNLTDLKLNSEE